MGWGGKQGGMERQGRAHLPRVLWAGWSRGRSDSFSKGGGEWCWGTNGLGREAFSERACLYPTFLEVELRAGHHLFLVSQGLERKEPPAGLDSPQSGLALARKAAEAPLPLIRGRPPTRQEPWISSACSSSTSSPAPSR